MGSDLLYARPSFLNGMAAVMDLGGTLTKEYNHSATPNLADYNALKSDWSVTGVDLFTAIDKFKKAHGE